MKVNETAQSLLNTKSIDVVKQIIIDAQTDFRDGIEFALTQALVNLESRINESDYICFLNSIA